LYSLLHLVERVGKEKYKIPASAVFGGYRYGFNAYSVSMQAAPTSSDRFLPDHLYGWELASESYSFGRKKWSGG
jgi:hypothetical protein